MRAPAPQRPPAGARARPARPPRGPPRGGTRPLQAPTPRTSRPASPRPARRTTPPRRVPPPFGPVPPPSGPVPPPPGPATRDRLRGRWVGTARRARSERPWAMGAWEEPPGGGAGGARGTGGAEGAGGGRGGGAAPARRGPRWEALAPVLYAPLLPLRACPPPGLPCPPCTRTPAGRRPPTRDRGAVADRSRPRSAPGAERAGAAWHAGQDLRGGSCCSFRARGVGHVAGRDPGGRLRGGHCSACLVPKS